MKKNISYYWETMFTQRTLYTIIYSARPSENSILDSNANSEKDRS